jgi:nicotinate-nucleotide adenylyltransferase
MQRIGILGGTFDPPHIGHLVLADCAIESVALDELLFVPAADPPHKRDETRASAAHRLAMLQLAIAQDGRFKLSRADIDRPGPHYAVDMVRLIQLQYPQAEMVFVMGADSLRDLPTWHCPQEFITLCKLAVMPRPAVRVELPALEELLPGVSARIVTIDAPLIEISSTEIVERLRDGKSVRYLVPPPVLDYISAKQVYQG